MSVGWIGLGKIGRPVVECLIAAGFDMLIQNRSQDSVRRLVASGARDGGSYAEMAAVVHSLHTMLPDGEAVEEVLAGPAGVFAGMRPGLVIVDHSTIRPSLARSFAERAASLGGSYLDAPISGGVPHAIGCGLTFMVGGDAEALKRVEPVLRAVGKAIFHMGPSGAGSVAKLINILIMGSNAAAAMEGLLLGTRLGVDPWTLFEAIQRSSGGSGQWDRNVPRILRNECSPEGPVDLLARNLGLAVELAEECGAALPLLEASRGFWQRAAELIEGEDMAAAYRTIR